MEGLDYEDIEIVSKIQANNFYAKIFGENWAFFIKLVHWIKGLKRIRALSYMDFQYMDSFIDDKNAQKCLNKG
jgi:hypothetical protein